LYQNRLSFPQQPQEPGQSLARHAREATGLFRFWSNWELTLTIKRNWMKKEEEQKVERKEGKNE